MLVKVGGKKLEVHRCNFFQKIVGLMFSRKKDAKALLFEFKNPTNLTIHSMFVFFPFLALWIDGKGRIIEKRIISPWKWGIQPKKSFLRLIEIPFNRRYFKTIKHFS